ncbi:MAG: hypothetical protein JSU00_29675 [Acidobacteria bacterium]|nr:hypothetical protein [Acidobacteriota bacterium]
MDSQLDKALQDLEQSTEALLEASQADLLGLCAALEKRADAITRIAFLVEVECVSSPDALERLSAALERGDGATRKALKMRQDAIEEWSRLNQLLRGVQEVREPEIICSA